MECYLGFTGSMWSEMLGLRFGDYGFVALRWGLLGFPLNRPRAKRHLRGATQRLDVQRKL